MPKYERKFNGGHRDRHANAQILICCSEALSEPAKSPKHTHPEVAKLGTQYARSSAEIATNGSPAVCCECPHVPPLLKAVAAEHAIETVPENWTPAFLREYFVHE